MKIRNRVSAVTGPRFSRYFAWYHNGLCAFVVSVEGPPDESNYVPCWLPPVFGSSWQKRNLDVAALSDVEYA